MSEEQAFLDALRADPSDEVTRLRDQECLSFTRIAERLGLNPGTARRAEAAAPSRLAAAMSDMVLDQSHAEGVNLLEERFEAFVFCDP